MSVTSETSDAEPKLMVFLIKNGVKTFSIGEDGKNGGGAIVQLRHPRTNKAAMFMFSAKNDVVYEIVSHDPPNKSWFIDNYVKSDGKLYLSAPVDPIYLVLPYLYSKCRKTGLPLNEILTDPDFPEVNRLLNCSGLDYLHLAAEKKDKNYQFSEQKLLCWLNKKYQKVTAALGAHTSLTEPDVIAKEACGMLAQYLSININQIFTNNHSIMGINPSGKRKSGAVDEDPSAKRSRK